MDSQILEIILKDTYTLSQAKHRLNVLKSHLVNSFFGGNISENLSAPDSNWLNSLPDSFIGLFNNNNVYDNLAEVESKINKIQTLTIYLAFEFNDTAIAQIGAFARKIIEPSLLLDIKYDPDLIAGAAFVWNGVYKDYSLRSKIDERKGEILESFKQFLR